MFIADRDYPMGTLVHMGPGNFPAALGVILSLFGVYLAARGLWHWAGNLRRGKEAALDFVQAGQAPLPLVWAWRPVTCIVASMLAFGFLLPRTGLIASLIAMFFVAALGGREFRWREVLVLALVMTALAVGVFVYLLKLPFQLVPGFYLV